MSAYIDLVYFNEFYFKLPPLRETDEEGNRYAVHKKRLSENVTLKLFTHGPHTLQVALEEGRSGRLDFLFSLYDAQYRLVDRETAPFAEMLTAVRDYPVALTGLLNLHLDRWFGLKNSELYSNLAQGVITAVKDFEKHAGESGKVETVQDKESREKHAIYHRHRAGAEKSRLHG